MCKMAKNRWETSENRKYFLWEVFDKYHRMKKILANPIEPRVTQSFEAIVVQGGLKGSSVEKVVISKVDAETYVYLIDKAIEQLPDTEEKPYKRIIRYKYIEGYSARRISIMIDYSIDSYFKKLRDAQIELCEILDLWGIAI